MRVKIIMVLVFAFVGAIWAADTGSKSATSKEEEDASEFIAYDSKKSIKKLLEEYKGDFSSDLF